MQKRALLVVVVITLLLLGGTYVLLGERQVSDHAGIAGERLFPALESMINDVGRIRIEHSGETYEVVNSGGGQWELQSRIVMPVMFTQVKQLLLGIALLEKVEPKTTRPENYPRLGVEDPGAEIDNFQITLFANGKEPVASVIIGKIYRSMIAGNRDGVYVRKPGEQQSWLVAGKVDLPAAQVEWVDRSIIDIKPKAVRRLAISHPDGSRLEMAKRDERLADFSLLNLPEGLQIESQESVDSLSRALARLEMEDLPLRSEDAAIQGEPVTAEFETWDGLMVTVRTVEKDGRILAWFEVGVTALEATDLTQVRTTGADVDELRSRLNGWIYPIPASAGDKLRQRLDDLVKEESA